MKCCLDDGMAKALPDRHFFSSVVWDSQKKIVFDRRSGQIYPELTNEERAKRGLPVPWKLCMLKGEIRQAAVP
jgi:hypothetical protein